MCSICGRRFATPSVSGTWGSGMGTFGKFAHRLLLAPHWHIYCLSLTVCELFSWIQKRFARPSDPDTMTNTAQEAIALRRAPKIFICCDHVGKNVGLTHMQMYFPTSTYTYILENPTKFRPLSSPISRSLERVMLAKIAPTTSQILLNVHTNFCFAFHHQVTLFERQFKAAYNFGNKPGWSWRHFPIRPQRSQLILSCTVCP